MKVEQVYNIYILLKKKYNNKYYKKLQDLLYI